MSLQGRPRPVLARLGSPWPGTAVSARRPGALIGRARLGKAVRVSPVASRRVGACRATACQCSARLSQHGYVGQAVPCQCVSRRGCPCSSRHPSARRRTAWRFIARQGAARRCEAVYAWKSVACRRMAWCGWARLSCRVASWWVHAYLGLVSLVAPTLGWAGHGWAGGAGRHWAMLVPPSLCRARLGRSGVVQPGVAVSAWQGSTWSVRPRRVVARLGVAVGASQSNALPRASSPSLELLSRARHVSARLSGRHACQCSAGLGTPALGTAVYARLGDAEPCLSRQSLVPAWQGRLVRAQRSSAGRRSVLFGMAVRSAFCSARLVAAGRSWQGLAVRSVHGGAWRVAARHGPARLVAARLSRRGGAGSSWLSLSRRGSALLSRLRGSWRIAASDGSAVKVVHRSAQLGRAQRALARPGCPGEARHTAAQHVSARHGQVRPGSAGNVRRGAAQLGTAGRVTAVVALRGTSMRRQGGALLGVVGRGTAGPSMLGRPSLVGARLGTSRRGWAVLSVLVEVRRGPARQYPSPHVAARLSALGYAQLGSSSQGSSAARQGVARLSMHCGARRGGARPLRVRLGKATQGWSWPASFGVASPGKPSHGSPRPAEVGDVG